LRINPNFAPANFKMGLAQAALNRHQVASEYYRRAIKSEPGNYDVHYFLSLSCLLSKRYLEALIAVRESLRLNPQNAEAQYMLGHIHMKLGQYKKAIQPLQSAINLEPKFIQSMPTTR
jgi:superkiller protein 3